MGMKYGGSYNLYKIKDISCISKYCNCLQLVFEDLYDLKNILMKIKLYFVIKLYMCLLIK